MSSYHVPLLRRSIVSDKPQPRDTSVCRSVDFSRPHAWNRWSHEYVEGPSRSRCCRQMIRLLPAELSRHNAIAVPLPTIQRLRPSALRNVLAAMNLRPAGNPRSRPIAGLGQTLRIILQHSGFVSGPAVVFHARAVFRQELTVYRINDNHGM